VAYKISSHIKGNPAADAKKKVNCYDLVDVTDDKEVRSFIEKRFT